MRRLVLLTLVHALAFALGASAAVAGSHADLALDLPFPARVPLSRPSISGTVRNNGPDLAENVTVVATASSGQQFEIALGTIYPLAGKSFLLTFPASDAEFRVDARVRTTTPDPDASNDSASGSVQVTRAPQISVYVIGSPADPGQAAEYQATFFNNGQNDASHVGLTIPLDDGWTFGESRSPRLHCTATAQQANCVLDTLAAGESLTARFTLIAPNHRDGDPTRYVPAGISSDEGVFQVSTATILRGIYRHVAVTNTADDGEGSLRQAIVLANATTQVPGCKVDFDIPLADGQRVATIRPLTPLPPLSTPALFLDGSTQRLTHGDTNPDGPEVEINGSNLQSGNGLERDGGVASYTQVVFRELVVNGFPDNGINVGAGSSSVIGCYVGTDPTGRLAVPNRGRGVVISGGATIRDSVISGNGRSGIFAIPANGTTIMGNRIGVAAGSAFLPLGNGASGIYFGPGSYSNAVTGNVIAFNRDAGISIGANAVNNTISENANSSNGGLPIDYGLDGVTAGGVFAEPPPLPALTATHFDPAAAQTIVEGHTSGGAFRVLDRVELFASESGEPRQAALFVGSVTPADSTGNFRFVYDGDLRGRFITATYTTPSRYYPEDLGFRTSEVSASIAVEGEAAPPLRRLPRGTDLVLQFGIGPAYQINAGDLYTVNYSYTNQGPDEALDVTLTIDVAGPFAGVRLNNGTSDATCRLEGSGRIVCTQPRLAAGARTSSSFLVQAPMTHATINLTALLTSSTEELDRASNMATLALTVDDTPALSVTAQSPGPAEPGATVVYDMYVQNFKRVPVSDITLTIPLRTGWAFAGASGEGWQCASDGAAVTCRHAALEGESGAPFQLMLRAPADPAGQLPDVSFIKVTTTPPLVYDPRAALTTQVLRIYRVTSAADTGAGTLRDALTHANAECPPFNQTCRIAFNLPPPVPPQGYYSIRPQTPLPAITSNLVIDGRTQTAATGDSNPLGPEVELNGSETATGHGILIHASQGAGVRGLAINRFPENGVAIDDLPYSYGATRVIADCYIGTDATGRIAAPNGLRGIGVQGKAGYSVYVDIVDNVISGNTRSGIFVDTGSQLRIAGNRIGVAAGEGMTPLGNGASGIYLGSAQSADVNGNVVAFNHDVGIGMDLSASSIAMKRNVLLGNGGLGIDYGLDGVTVDDPVSASQPFPRSPLITSATWDAASGVTRIEGIAPAGAVERGSIDLYRTSAAGSTEEWVGEVILEASSGPRPFTFTVSRNLQGSLAIATFTRGVSAYRGTSELSAAVPVTP